MKSETFEQHLSAAIEDNRPVCSSCGARCSQTYQHGMCYVCTRERIRGQILFIDEQREIIDRRAAGRGLSD